MAGKGKVRPDCVNASNPFHVCADYCLQRSPNPKVNIDGAKSPVRNGDPDCVNASNPFHQCADYCTKKKECESEKSGRFTLPVLKISPRSSSSSWRSEGGKSVQNRERLGEDRRNIDPNCVNASNPFHKCRDYCTKKTVDTKKPSDIGKEVQNGELIKEEVRKIEIEEYVKEEVRKAEEGMKVDPMRVCSSDPFHKCSEYCSQKNGEESKSMTLGDLLARESEEELASRKNRKEEAVIRGDKKVDPRCPNASNPFHECADYCLQKIGGSGWSEGGKSDRSKGSGSGRSEGGKSDRSKGRLNIVMDKRDVDPRCMNASNPFHKCAEYCFERIREST